MAVTSAAGEIVIDTVYNSGTALTVGAGQTQRWNLAPGGEGAGSTEPGASTVTMSWSQPTGSWVIGGVSVKSSGSTTWSATVSWGTTYTGLSVDVSPQNNYVALARSFIPTLEAEIAYRSTTGSGVNYPKTRTWDGTSSSGSETQLANAGSDVRQVEMAWSPVDSNTRIIVTQGDSDGWLDAYVCTPTCTVTNNIGQADAPASPGNIFDVAYEYGGDALLAYGVLSTNASRDLAYRVYSGGSWSGEQYIDDAGHATDVQYSTVNLAARPYSDQIGLVAGDSTNSHVNAWIWDGSAFGSETEITAGAEALSREKIAIAWETASGHLLAAAVPNNSPNVVYKEYTTSWSAASTFDCASDNSEFIVLKPNPLSTANDMILATSDSFGAEINLHTCYWNGSGFSNKLKHDALIDTEFERVWDFAWESSGSKGLLVWGTTSGQITYKTFTAPNTWGSATDVAYGSNTKRWVQAITNRFPVSGGTRILGAVLENADNDLGAIKWDGTTLTVIGDTTFTADTGTGSWESFGMEYRVVGQEFHHVVCKDFSTSSCDAAAEFTKWDGAAGSDLVATTVEAGSYPSLVTTYESNGDLWIAYAKDTGTASKAIYARNLDYPGGGWQAATTVDSLGGTTFARPSIGIDKDNNVHALYVATSGPQVYYNKRTGGSWGARSAVEHATSDSPTLMVRAPDNATYGADVGGLYWKTSSSETYFFYQTASIPEFEAVALPILGILVLVLWRRRSRRSRAEHKGSDHPIVAGECTP